MYMSCRPKNRSHFVLRLVTSEILIRSVLYFAPRSTQPSIPPRSINADQLRLGRRRLVWLIPLEDETQGVQVKPCYPLTMRAIPERLRDVWCGGAIQIDDLYLYFECFHFSSQSGLRKN